MKIELVYFEGCPNAAAARENLRKACVELGLKAEWQEWDQNDGATPAHIKAFGSPSILVDGKDVEGSPDGGCARQSCRLYEGGQNAPNIEVIKAALRAGRQP